MSEYSTASLEEEFPSVTHRAPVRVGRIKDEIPPEWFDPYPPPISERAPEPEKHKSSSEILSERIEKAARDCEIYPSEEVKEALKGYYEDHYHLAALIDTSLDGVIDEDELDRAIKDSDVDEKVLAEGLENIEDAGFVWRIPSTKVASALLAKAAREGEHAQSDEKLKRDRALAQCAALLVQEVLFGEASLGITTLGEDEIQIIRELHAKISETAKKTGAEIDEDGRITWKTRIHELVIGNAQTIVGQLKERQENFWEDCRYAGQLEFHNTGNFAPIGTSVAILPRTEQFRKRGVMHTQTPLGAYSTSDGRSKMHSVVPHFSEFFDPSDMYTRGKGAKGSFAVPLAEIIKVAPYARDAHYALVRPKDIKTLEKVPLETRAGSEKTINAYADDIPAKWGADRVFFASPSESGSQKPDEYQIPLYMTDATQIFLQGRDYKDDHREISGEVWYPVGENMPKPLFIDKGIDIKTTIEDLQQDYKRRYKDRLVVPLRRGVFDFAPEHMGSLSSGYHKESEYNVLPEDFSKFDRQGAGKYEAKAA